jgi:molecular chaperone GrpE
MSTDNTEPSEHKIEDRGPGADGEAGMESPNAAAQPETARAELEAEIAKLKEQVLRAMAETENTRRRLEQQAEERGKYAIASFAKDILQVADNLRRALDSIPAQSLAGDELAKSLAEGVELTERSLIASLERFGVKRVAAMGQKFDPHLHQAMMEVPDATLPPGTVVSEMQAGYTLHDRLLRPAMVGVSKGGAAAGPDPAHIDTRV